MVIEEVGVSGAMGGTVETLGPGDAEAVVDVLVEAFRDYPVMRHVLGPAPFEALRTLIGFFVSARVLRHEPMLGIRSGPTLVAAALVTPPGTREAPPALAERREAVWTQLGSKARERYEALGAVWRQFAIPEANYHLNMIGVRDSHAGRGLGRRVIDRVHEISRRDPDSAGVTLTTETPRNVPLYEHLGYRVIGHVRLTDELETWGFFRPDH